MVLNTLVWKQPRLRALSASGALRAWTGGSTPAPLSTIGPDEMATVSAFFREQVADYVAYWGTIGRDHLRIFWGRARYDAHATHRVMPKPPAYWTPEQWAHILELARTVRLFAPGAKRGSNTLLYANRAARDLRTKAKSAMRFHSHRLQRELGLNLKWLTPDSPPA